MLDERRLIDSEAGRVSVGWIIVEDLVMVLAIVLLPALAGLWGGDGGSTAAPAELSVPAIVAAIRITLGKAAAFVAIMLVVGQRVIRWALHHIAVAKSATALLAMRMFRYPPFPTDSKQDRLPGKPAQRT